MSLVATRSQRGLRALPVLFRTGGERMLLCRLEPFGGAGPSDGALGRQARDLAALFEAGADAIVMTDAAGAITLANEAFLDLTDGTDLRSVRGRSLADFLVRGGIDLNVLMEAAGRAGKVRLYATRAKGEYGGERRVTIAATHLPDRARPGFAFVIRDAGTAPPVAPDAPEAAARPVVDLVGSTSMKDIVAQTADVVERMCIEAAIEMTGNNRVAAAEMLGLSRQSLYVKLRKYGMLAKGD